jgi:glycosidase
MEFHIARSIRRELALEDVLFSFTGNVIFANVSAARKLARELNELRGQAAENTHAVNGGAIFAMGLIDELSHAMFALYRKQIDPRVTADAMRWFQQRLGKPKLDRLLLAFTEQFPNTAIFSGDLTAQQWLAASTEGLPNREAALEELIMLWLANRNPAFTKFRELFADDELKLGTTYTPLTAGLPAYFATRPPVSPTAGTLLEALQAPMLAAPDSLVAQLEFIRERWELFLGPELKRALLAIDVVREEDIAIWMRFHPTSEHRPSQSEPGWRAEGFQGDEYVGFDDEFIIGPDGVRRPRYALDHQAPLHEYEAFSPDQAWMPTVVMMAKNTYVWLEQLSKKYQRPIHRLDQIPDEELRTLAERGMTALWLIGLWERSVASQTIKRLRGQADAVASAYSLKEYNIANDLGGNQAYEDLRARAGQFGLRMASDMVPNHMGIDSPWVIEHPEWFIHRSDPPFPSYSFNGPDLSADSRAEIKLEDHYYDQTDAAVAFRLRTHADGQTRYVYHGNDGTTFAWNDTAQLDYSKADVREHVMQIILHVARLSPIIRFDAAMVLAKRHVQRLWFPLPGVGGSIPSRAENAMSNEEFDALMPHEFWREVVDRVAIEVPGTLLLAEAFWLLEGYFVRTLGMHRVYNSAFMNMLRDEENAKYRSYLKKTIEFDTDILKRYVNFMSNPDEKTAAEQFGDGDKYFGTCTLLATLPGLPMFAHGQIEGFSERYGMDFKEARVQEVPSQDLIARYQREIAPLLRNRKLFAESQHFVLYDLWLDSGSVDENVIAYSNRYGNDRAVVLYNNVYGETRGTIHVSTGFFDKSTGEYVQRPLHQALALPDDNESFVVYRDANANLEHLVRASDLRDHGLTLSMQAYQYIVLQQWRVFHASAERPWDRLCDDLQGRGVSNLDEALIDLRLRPVHDALAAAVNCANAEAFIQTIHEAAKSAQATTANQTVSQATKGTKPVNANLTINSRKTEPATSLPSKVPPTKPYAPLPAEVPPTKSGTPLVTDAPPTNSGAPHLASEIWDPTALDQPLPNRLHPFIEACQSFYTQLSSEHVSHAASTTSDVPAKPIEALAHQALSILDLSNKIPSEWTPAAQRVAPLATANAPAQWAQLLAAITLAGFPGSAPQRELFDKLRLRNALARIFNTFGIHGEDSWRAAARVRMQLQQFGTPDEALRTNAFWADPDTGWLLGLNESNGITYFDKFKYEELLTWLHITQPLAPAKLIGPPSAERLPLQQLADLAAESGYSVIRFRALLKEPKSAESAKPALIPAKPVRKKTPAKPVAK